MTGQRRASTTTGSEELQLWIAVMSLEMPRSGYQMCVGVPKEMQEWIPPPNNNPPHPPEIVYAGSIQYQGDVVV